MAQAGGVEFVSQGSYKVGASGITAAAKVNMDGAVKNTGAGSDTEMAMKMKLELIGQEVETDFWYRDGYYYVDTGGEKKKYPMDTEELENRLESQLGMAELEEEDFKSIEAQKDGNTIKIIYTMDGDQLQSMINLLLELVNKETNSPNAGFSLEEVKGILVVDKKNTPISNQISLQMQMTSGGQQLDFDMEMKINYEEIGENVEIVFPDFSQFPAEEQLSVA